MGGNNSPLLFFSNCFAWILEPKTKFGNVIMIKVLAITEFKISYNNRYNYNKVGLQLLL